MRKLLISLGVLASLMVAGCAVHRIDIQQGNVLDPETVEDIRLGMTKRQVQFLLGTPLIVDPFHTDRWDFVFTMQRGRDDKEKRRVTLIFEEEKLSQIVQNDAASESVN